MSLKSIIPPLLVVVRPSVALAAPSNYRETPATADVDPLTDRNGSHTRRSTVRLSNPPLRARPEQEVTLGTERRSGRAPKRSARLVQGRSRTVKLESQVKIQSTTWTIRFSRSGRCRRRSRSLHQRANPCLTIDLAVNTRARSRHHGDRCECRQSSFSIVAV